MSTEKVYTVRFTKGLVFWQAILVSCALIVANLSGQTPSTLAGMLAYFPGRTTVQGCPAGWSEATAVRGFYVVGLPSGGTQGSTVGAALSDLENRSHTHSLPSLSVGGLTFTGVSGSTSVAHTHPFQGGTGGFSISGTTDATGVSGTTGATGVSGSTSGPDATTTFNQGSGGSVTVANSGHDHTFNAGTHTHTFDAGTHAHTFSASHSELVVNGTTDTSSSTAHTHTYSGTTSAGSTGTGTSGGVSTTIAPYLQYLACLHQ